MSIIFNNNIYKTLIDNKKTKILFMPKNISLICGGSDSKIYITFWILTKGQEHIKQIQNSPGEYVHIILKLE